MEKNTTQKREYLTGEELSKMHGQTVLFCIGHDYYAAKVSVGMQGVFMCNTRVNGGAPCPNQLGFRGNWFIKYSEVAHYFIFQDDALAEPLIAMDKMAAEYYMKSEQFMADMDADAKIIMKEPIAEALAIKRDVAEEAFRLAATDAEKATSDEGIKIYADHQKNSAGERFSTLVAAWDIKPAQTDDMEQTNQEKPQEA